MLCSTDVSSSLLFFPACPSKATAEKLTAADLLAKYEQTLAMFQKATFRVHVLSYSDWPGFSPQGGPYRDDSFQIWVDGERWKQMESCVSRGLERGRVRADKEGNELLCSGKGSISVVLDAEGRPKGILASLQELSEEQRRRISCYQRFSVAINGGMDFDQFSLPETLHQSQLSAREVRWDGRRLWLLEGTGPWGYHALWLDPQQGFLPRRILQRKQGEDKMFWGQGQNTTVDTVPSERYGPWKQASQQWDITRFGTANSKPVITGFTLTSAIQTAQGVRSPDTTHARHVVSFSEINLNPDFSRDPFVITTRIPNGLHVTVREQRGIDYEWRDGEIVKSVNQSSVGNLEGHWFQGGSLFGRGLLLLAFLVVGGFSFLCWYKRRVVKREIQP